MPSPPDRSRISQPPRGTRDFYPIEMARRRWIEDKWRRAAVRHGFDEIDGPTFEHLDLYTVKSGEGIVSELFSFKRAGGETDFALRPEFTPTLARMVAAKANALPKPVKWFSIGPYFRAERPQRGRLREFLQWNVDVLGDESQNADTELIASCIDMLESVGLTPEHVRILINNREIFTKLLSEEGVPAERHLEVFNLLDEAPKIANEEFHTRAESLGIPDTLRLWFGQSVELPPERSAIFTQKHHQQTQAAFRYMEELLVIQNRIEAMGYDPNYIQASVMIVRGLAYYTGTVFEVHERGGKERAIAGGGRYDNLVELFGGPPTPAVGFAMGDVVLSLVLQDKGLMPSDDQIARDLGLNPDVFVITNGDEPSEQALAPVLAALRRAGLHARRSYKSTRNVGKLLQEAGKSGARFALILESGTSATLKDMGKQGASEDAQRQLRADTLEALIEQAAANIPPR